MLKCNWDLLISTSSVILTPLLMELDEQWSYVGKKQQQRWLWLAICHKTSQIVAYCFGRRTHESFELLLKTLQHFKVELFFSDDWSSYSKYIPEEYHNIGKRNTQKIERKFLTFRTRIKRLARKSICFSKNELMHDTVIGLYINRVEWGRNI